MTVSYFCTHDYMQLLYPWFQAIFVPMIKSIIWKHGLSATFEPMIVNHIQTRH